MHADEAVFVSPPADVRRRPCTAHAPRDPRAPRRTPIASRPARCMRRVRSCAASPRTTRSARRGCMMERACGGLAG
eukprot:212536-Prymnesium_polylepis.1